jgi:hypothetical protein
MCTPQKGVDRSSQFVFDYKTNMMEVGITQDFSKPANSVLALGSGFGGAQKRSTYTDTISRGIQKLRQQRVSYSEVSEEDTLSDKAEAVVSQYKQPRLLVSFKQVRGTQPEFGSLSLGDTFKIRINKDIHNIDNRFRLYGWSVKIDKNNLETITYEAAL